MGNWLKSGLFSNKPKGNKGEIEVPPMPSYKRYVALINQTGTDAPVATVLENNLGDTLDWFRDNVGKYSCSYNGYGIFEVATTFIILGPLNRNYPDTIALRAGWANDQILFEITDGGVYFDGLVNIPVEIRVY